uniref:Uncharacterized protein n=1 Tax=Faxonius propinquus nudivirus TaxID=3139431 RepID=A0AAU8GFB1_9VIRU
MKVFIFFADIDGFIASYKYDQIQNINNINKFKYISNANGLISNYYIDKKLIIGDVLFHFNDIEQISYFIIINYYSVRLAGPSNFNWSAFINNLLSLFTDTSDLIYLHLNNNKNIINKETSYNTRSLFVESILKNISKKYQITIE